jgi:hypothetical protein
MTVGALTQLEYGNTDRMAFLTLNPQITHFKSVYKKYTNFATQFIRLQPTGSSTGLSWNADTTYTFTIPRNGDAIRDIYLTLELPDIYSDSNYKFQWIKRIGEYIVRDVTLQIDTNQNIDKHSGEWFHAYSELNYDEGKKKGYYKMIGNVPELYDPSNAPGNTGQYPSYLNKYAPSIINRKLYLPLIFWFNKFASMSLPLIALQLKPVYIVFNFRPLKELYTIIDYTGSGGTGYRIKPSNATNVNNAYIGNFLQPVSPTQNNLDLNPQLEINNVFLDNEERKRFAMSAHDYLITQLQPIIQQRVKISQTTGFKLDLSQINKPVTEFVFMIRRTDMEDVNDWSNYTNWNIADIPPYSLSYVNPYGLPLTINSTNIQYYKTRNILKSATIRIQGNEITEGDVPNNDLPLTRLSGKDSVFYNLIQNFNSNRNMPDEGIYTYSFSLDNTSLQPIGAINMSSITNKDIILNLTAINQSGGYNYPSGTSYDYVVILFAINYDILRFIGGMAGLASSN